MEEIIKPRRILCVGDIHGGMKSLLQVLNRSKFKVEEDQFICLGDYVDGWSESADVVDFLIELQKTCTFKPIFLRGNHDVWCQEWLNTGERKPMWVVQGGQATLDSYISTEYFTKQEHKDFFNGLHNYYVDEENRGFVHGGFISKNGLFVNPFSIKKSFRAYNKVSSFKNLASYSSIIPNFSIIPLAL